MVEPIINCLESMDFSIKVHSDRYYNQEGVNVPRVTEIISSMLHNDSLMYWANSLGFKGIRYKDALTSAGNIGTKAHDAIEMYLQEKLKDTSNIPLQGFLLWYDIITARAPVKILMIEERMVGRWFGGTLDCLIAIGGRMFLMDFKTSNHVTYNYFLQLASYRYLLRELHGIEVAGVIVLQLNKNEPGFNEYLLDFAIPEHLMFMMECERCFFSLVYAYYNRKYIEERFQDIFKGGRP